MSLSRQLWIAVVVLMTLAFASSFAISTLNARDYFEEQLRLKNIDNAASLALNLSQADKAPSTISLLVAAQFDTGHYQRIELRSPRGELVEQRRYEGEEAPDAPAWFHRLVPIRVEPGVAHVQEGWHQFGTLTLESQVGYAYGALWQATRELLLWFLLVALACGLAGTALLKWLTRPLEQLVVQAEAIGNRRFITSAEPATLEFKRVVRAMNQLSSRMQQVLESEARRLEELRYKHQHDPVTGLANREYLLGLLDAQLAQREQGKHGLFLIRVRGLAELNGSLGYRKTDALLQSLATLLRHVTAGWGDRLDEAHCGRLNGSDFMLLLTDITELTTLSADLQRKLLAWSQAQDLPVPLLLPHAACSFRGGEQRGALLMTLDSLLAQAEQREETCAEIDAEGGQLSSFQNAEEWRQALQRALEENGVGSVRYPVLALDGRPLHAEAMMRLEIGGRVRAAGDFIPWARRLRLLPQLDLAMLEHVLSEVASLPEPRTLALNLSIETLADHGSRQALLALLARYPQQARRLWIELPERSVIPRIELFRECCAQLQPLGCKLGLERAGAGFAQLSHLQELGLDYLKVDSALIRELADNEGNQGFLRGLCTLAHSIGLLVIAEGVQSELELPLLGSIGFDGVGGPGVKAAGNGPDGAR